jgi:hypothetical protein
MYETNDEQDDGEAKRVTMQAIGYYRLRVISSRLVAHSPAQIIIRQPLFHFDLIHRKRNRIREMYYG